MSELKYEHKVLMELQKFIKKLQSIHALHLALINVLDISPKERKEMNLVMENLTKDIRRFGKLEDDLGKKFIS